MRPSTSSISTSWRREHLLGDRRPDEALLAHELRPAERLAEQLEVREPVLLEERARQPLDRHVELGEPAAISKTSGVVVSYWNRPVSQTRAA